MTKIRLNTLRIRGARQTKPEAYNIKPKDSDNKKILQAGKVSFTFAVNNIEDGLGNRTKAQFLFSSRIILMAKLSDEGGNLCNKREGAF